LVYLSGFVKHSISDEILTSFQDLVKIFHDQPLPTNTAAAVSLILLGLQTARIHSKLVGWAADSPSTPIQNVGVDHRCADIPVPQELMEGLNPFPTFWL
jgi:hypothetical protein